MVQGAQPNATGFVAFGIETTSGTPLAAPTKCVVLRGDIAPVSKKPPKFNDNVAGGIFPSMPLPGVESCEIPLPMYPIVDGNGMGELDAAQLGDDTLSELVASHAYRHTITWEDLIKTLTFFAHYGTNDDDQYRMCAVDSQEFKSKSSDNSVEFDYKTQGASMEHLTNGAVPTDQFIDMDDVDMLTHSQLRVEIGQPGAAIRETIDELSGSIKRNLAFGCLQKPGQHPAGSSSHNLVNSKKSNCELKISFVDTDREEIHRAMNPTNADPATGSRWTDIVGFIKAKMTWFGGILYAGVNGEADYCNAGTLAVTFAGTYTGGDTLLVGEMEINQGTPDQFRFRYTTGGAWSAWSEWADITTGAAVALTGCAGIEATFSSTTAGADGDKFYFYSHYRLKKRIVIPVLAYSDIPKTTFKDGKRIVELNFAHTSTEEADRPYMEIDNSENAAYC